MKLSKILSAGLIALSVGALSATAQAAPIVFSFTGAIETWTASATGTYKIVAEGAQGGSGLLAPTAGGRGAQIGGYFSLSSGTVLQIAVGEMGRSGTYNGGGGGGSFVVGSSDSPIIIAGGGGGTRAEASVNGFDANTGQAGLSGSGGDSNGFGGGIATSSIGLGGAAPESSWGSGGGGFNTDGVSDSPWGAGGSSWFNGLAGGPDFSGFCADGRGGFGGGGSGGGCGGGGGGGGYSGGDGGFVAGGGGSFNADLLTGFFLSGIGYGDGFVSIELVDAEVDVPAPGALALLGLGLFGFGALRRKRQAA